MVSSSSAAAAAAGDRGCELRTLDALGGVGGAPGGGDDGWDPSAVEDKVRWRIEEERDGVWADIEAQVRDARVAAEGLAAQVRCAAEHAAAAREVRELDGTLLRLRAERVQAVREGAELRARDGVTRRKIMALLDLSAPPPPPPAGCGKHPRKVAEDEAAARLSEGIYLEEVCAELRKEMLKRGEESAGSGEAVGGGAAPVATRQAPQHLVVDEAIMCEERKAAVRAAIEQWSQLLLDDEQAYARRLRAIKQTHAFQRARARELIEMLGGFDAEEAATCTALTRFLNETQGPTQTRGARLRDEVARLELELEEEKQVLCEERSRREADLEALRQRVLYKLGEAGYGGGGGGGGGEDGAGGVPRVAARREAVVGKRQALSARARAEEKQAGARRRRLVVLKEKAAALEAKQRKLSRPHVEALVPLGDVKAIRAAILDAEERLGVADCTIAKGRMARQARTLAAHTQRIAEPSEGVPEMVF